MAEQVSFVDEKVLLKFYSRENFIKALDTVSIYNDQGGGLLVEAVPYRFMVVSAPLQRLFSGAGLEFSVAELAAEETDPILLKLASERLIERARRLDRDSRFGLGWSR